MKDYRAPSGSLASERGFRFLADQFRLPCRNIIEIVWLHLAVGQDVERPHHVGVGRLRVLSALDKADKGLRDADLLGDPSLRSVVDLPPLRELHRRSPPCVQAEEISKSAASASRYCGQSYYVNGHDEKPGTEYNTVAYLFIMHPGNRLRELRKAARLTQIELGDRAGMAQETVSLYENGKRPLTLEHMRIFARELGCSVADLLADDDNPERLSPTEKALLDAFREVDSGAREFLLTSARAVAGKGLSRDAA